MQTYKAEYVGRDVCPLCQQPYQAGDLRIYAKAEYAISHAHVSCLQKQMTNRIASQEQQQQTVQRRGFSLLMRKRA